MKDRMYELYSKDIGSGENLSPPKNVFLIKLLIQKNLFFHLDSTPLLSQSKEKRVLLFGNT